LEVAPRPPRDTSHLASQRAHHHESDHTKHPAGLGTSRSRQASPAHGVSFILIVPTWTTYAVALLTGMPFMAAKLAELLFLIVAPVVVTRWIGGRAAVRQLYSGLTRWRLGLPCYLMILVAMPRSRSSSP
jgi:hypothetical protein